MFCASGLRVPASISRTISTVAVETGVGTPTSRSLRDDVAVHVIDLGGPALGHVLSHRGAPVASAGRGRGEHAVSVS